jgi:type IV secretory pathway VirB2 component (pilin)
MKSKIVLQRFIYVCLSLCLTFQTFADTYNISDGGEGSAGGFGLITQFFQKYVDFMTGPFSKTAMGAILIIGVLTWAVLPKEGIFGTVIRIVIAGIVVLNLATWMGMFGS